VGVSLLVAEILISTRTNQKLSFLSSLFSLSSACFVPLGFCSASHQLKPSVEETVVHYAKKQMKVLMNNKSEL
jgi:hypothetical protein